jgi:hypothetical protein
MNFSTVFCKTASIPKFEINAKTVELQSSREAF